MPRSYAYKLISPDSIPDALKKSERYRLLGEPDEAESVCLDILKVDPGNQDALIDLILALTDQFPRERQPRVALARQYADELTDEYQRRYYTAVVLEREARVEKDRDTPPALVFLRYRDAMDCYEQAALIRPPGDDSAILRWNACLRAIRRRQLAPGMEPEAWEKD
jgi:tetratricopeptide (TPR) repeat protein